MHNLLAHVSDAIVDIEYRSANRCTVKYQWSCLIRVYPTFGLKLQSLVWPPVVARSWVLSTSLERKGGMSLASRGLLGSLANEVRTARCNDIRWNVGVLRRADRWIPFLPGIQVLRNSLVIFPRLDGIDAFSYSKTIGERMSDILRLLCSHGRP